MQAADVLFTHPTLDDPVTAIGGHYVMTGEQQIEYQDERLLVFTGHAIFDTTCCGLGGCAYVLVAGFLKGYRCARDDAGRWMSKVRPVADGRLQTRVQAVVSARLAVQQVQFL